MNDSIMLSGKVLAVGAPIVDFLSMVPDDFLSRYTMEKGGSVDLTPDELDVLLKELPNELFKVSGGSAGNTIFGLAKMGVPVSMFGRLGNDENGNFYLQAMEKIGGDKSRFMTTNEAPTARCLSLITSDAQRTMRTALGASLLVYPEDITPQIFDDVVHVHVEGYFLFNSQTSDKFFQSAKAAGVTVSLDIGTFELIRYFREHMTEIIHNYVDIIFANEDEAREFCGEMLPHEQAKVLSMPGVLTVIKLGEDGCCVYKDGSYEYVPAKKVNAVDTTAAGDLWQCGFLYGYLNGYAPAKAAALGSLIAAEVVQVIGSQIPDERWDYICENLK